MNTNAPGTGHLARAVNAQRYSLPIKPGSGADLGRHPADEFPVPLLRHHCGSKKKNNERKKKERNERKR